jgi:diaminobutyrate-2-oxoglutarate transaminase
MRRLTAERGIPLIVDEVQTGVGRTGRLFAFEHAGIEPDVLVLAKAIGGGLPLAVILYRSELDGWEPGAHTGTFRGNQLAMAAGTATLREVVAARLDAHAAEAGRLLMDGLRAALADSPCAGDVRGRGLMVGVEIVDPAREPDATGALPADGRLARAVQLECLQRGLVVERGGRHGAVIRLLPPLIITAEQVATVVDRIADAVRAAARTRRTG